MHVTFTLTHDSRDRFARPGLFVPDPRLSHRPRGTYRVRIERSSDVRMARKAGLPIHLISPEVTAAWGFPHATGDILVAWRELAPLIDTGIPLTSLESATAARTPRLEDLVIVLLKNDPLLARALALRHQDFLDRPRFLKRILQENIEDVATRFGLQALLPALPGSGVPLSEQALARQDRNVWVGGRL